VTAQALAPYQTYAPSDVFWRGEIPQGWVCKPLKYAAELSTIKGAPSRDDRYVGMENIRSGDGSFLETEGLDPEGLSLSFSNGDVLFGKLRPYLAKAWLASFSGICSSEFLVLSARNVSPRFLNYTMLSPEFVSVVDSSTYGAKMPRASWDFVGMLKIAVPDSDTSAQIAKFLDYETAKIDALIEKQQQLIALLKEKRQAVISHAVTKGLNPDAPMRDSGVEWLGEVPAHWSVPRVGYVARVFNGSTPSRAVPQYWVDEGVPWLSSGKVNEDIVHEPTSWISKRALAECSIDLAPKGSVIVGMIGQGRTRATCAMLGIDSTINQNMAALVARWNLDSRYLYRVMTAAFDDLRLLGRGANQPALNCDILRAYRIPLPPLEEQHAIAEHTDAMLHRTARTIDLATQQGELLKERRTALISAAVTGKIDVRDWQPPVDERAFNEEAKQAGMETTA